MPARAGEDWLPITPDELKMTSEPQRRQAQWPFTFTAKSTGTTIEFREFNYARIKIFYRRRPASTADIEIHAPF